MLDESAAKSSSLFVLFVVIWSDPQLKLFIVMIKMLPWRLDCLPLISAFIFFRCCCGILLESSEFWKGPTVAVAAGLIEMLLAWSWVASFLLDFRIFIDVELCEANALEYKRQQNRPSKRYAFQNLRLYYEICSTPLYKS